MSYRKLLEFSSQQLAEHFDAEQLRTLAELVEKTRQEVDDVYREEVLRNKREREAQIEQALDELNERTYY